MQNLKRCREFYEKHGAPMLHERFGEYENRIAVGMVGEGSDCFGFDDAISTDHDYGTGFCMWLTDSDYAEIGEALSKAYGELMQGERPEGVQLFMNRRRGVFTVSDFYNRLLGEPFVTDNSLSGTDTALGAGAASDADMTSSADKALGADSIRAALSDAAWIRIPEDRLAAAVNGEVFRDDMGAFTKVREYLEGYYPDRVWKRRLAEELYHYSQNAQSNYARMMARQDYVTAGICTAQAMKAAMELVYLLNRRYAPYYKWLRRGMDRLSLLSDLGQLLDAMAQVGCQADAWQGKQYHPYEINTDDPLVRAFEVIAGQILKELNRQGIVNGDNPFLDIYSKQLLSELP